MTEMSRHLVRVATCLASSALLLLLPLADAGAAPRSPIDPEPAWVATLSAATGDTAWANGAVTATRGNAVFVSGRLDSEAAGSDITTVAYRANDGRILWQASYDGDLHGSDNARDLAVSDDGTLLFVLGQTPGDLGRVVTIAYDTTSGEQQWTAVYGSWANPTEVVAAGDRVFVTSQRQVDGRNVYATVAYDARSGEQLWEAQYGFGDSSASVRDLAVSPDGERLFVTGQVRPAGTLGQYGTVAYDVHTGEQLWDAQFGVPGGLAFPEDIAVSPDSRRVYVTGTSDDASGDTGAGTVGYDAGTGQRVWSARYNSEFGSTDAASALTVSPDGETVYVGGHAFESFLLSHLVTLAYDADTGEQRWVDLYEAEGGDWNQALDLVARRDHLYVTGRAVGIPALAFGSDGTRQSMVGYGAGSYFAGRSQGIELAVTHNNRTLVAVGHLRNADGDLEWTVAGFRLR
ncbi:MAG: PQQ-binding-like beta-propeller repeat protein [Propionibacteriales bacterium]|nr:PQQ-binding-like beta-propeller repeat protein [Propionibacteriales bacterium]